MASAFKKVKKKFQKGKRKAGDKDMPPDSTSDEAEEKSSLESALPGQTSQGKPSQPSCNIRKDPNCCPGVGLSQSRGHEAGKITTKMSHSLEHPGSPDCPSIVPCHKSQSLETTNNNNKKTAFTGAATALPTGEPENPVNSGPSANAVTAAGQGSSHGNQQANVPAANNASAAFTSGLLNPVNNETFSDGLTATGHGFSCSNKESNVPAATPTAGSNTSLGSEPPNLLSNKVSPDGLLEVDERSSHNKQESNVPASVATAGGDATLSDEAPNPVNSEMSSDGHSEVDWGASHSNQESNVSAAIAGDGSATLTGEPPNPQILRSSDDFTAASNPHSSAATAAATTTASSATAVTTSMHATVPAATAAAAADPDLNEGESSLQSLTRRPIQEQPEQTTGNEDNSTGELENATNYYEHFLVSEKINNKFLHDKIALGLDRTSHRIIKTWEHLACTEEIYAPLEVRLKCKINREHSCTLMLFDVVTAEMEEKTLKDMIDALTSIRRNDVKKIITDVYSDAADSTEKFSDFAASQDNSNIITQMATLLDQKSRVNPNWFNLGQQLQLSGERLKEIEYGQFTQVLMEYLYTKKTDLTIGTFYEVVEKLKRRDVLKKLDPFIVEQGDRDKLMKHVIEIESDAMRGICVCLNNPNTVMKNWRHLAKSPELGIPEDIYKGVKPENPKSPTESLFEWIFANKVDLTVGQLCKALERIDRNDIVRDIREHFEQQRR